MLTTAPTRCKGKNRFTRLNRGGFVERGVSEKETGIGQPRSDGAVAGEQEACETTRRKLGYDAGAGRKSHLRRAFASLWVGAAFLSGSGADAGLGKRPSVSRKPAATSRLGRVVLRGRFCPPKPPFATEPLPRIPHTVLPPGREPLSRSCKSLVHAWLACIGELIPLGRNAVESHPAPELRLPLLIRLFLTIPRSSRVAHVAALRNFLLPVILRFVDPLKSSLPAPPLHHRHMQARNAGSLRRHRRFHEFPCMRLGGDPQP